MLVFPHLHELQIVEIPVPEVILQRVEVPMEVEVVRTVVAKEKEIEQVLVEKLINLNTTEEKIVTVEVEKRIPYEVVREIPV